MGEFQNGIFFGGLFSNYPALVAWSKQPNGSYETKGIGNVKSVRGAILSISHMTVPGTENMKPAKDGEYTWFLVVGCMLSGIIVGAIAAVTFHYYSPNSRVFRVTED